MILFTHNLISKAPSISICTQHIQFIRFNMRPRQKMLAHEFQFSLKVRHWNCLFPNDSSVLVFMR